jgi:hypothetical protein
MFRSPTKFVGLALILVACGSPGDLDDQRFPPPGQTGYADDPALGASGAAGTGGSGGGSGSGTGGSSGSAGQTGQGGAGVQPSGNCPDDISVLFNRPGPQGGCQGDGCHVPGGQRPDLTSPGVEARLLNVTSSCNGRPYISADYSFMESKLVGNPPDCGGYPMPFLSPAALNAADKQCILDWIDEVAAGM